MISRKRLERRRAELPHCACPAAVRSSSGDYPFPGIYGTAAECVSFRARFELLDDTQEATLPCSPLHNQTHGLLLLIFLVDHNQAKSDKMPVSRMRMRPWLEKMIDSNTVPGLHWVDKDRTMFSIPWKHAARHGWELDKDASLFKEWAIHTGKYVQGQTSDPKTWKANFRCAMNSLPDIEEVKDKSVNKGHQAVRVFKLLPVTLKGREKRNRIAKRRRNTKVKCEEESSDSDCVPSPMQSTHIPSPQDSRVDSTMQPEPHVPELPDWMTLDTGFTRHFEVSPSHSTLGPEDDDIIEICAQWERERLSWMPSGLSNNGFLTNEPQCTSPGSQYSESSSADEFDEHPKYTTLGTTFLSNDYSFTPFSLF